MSHKITLEEEKIVGSIYADFSQASIRRLRGHGTTQIARILQPKNLAKLLYYEMESHGRTKYVNKDLQEELNWAKIILVVTWFSTWICWFLLAYYL